MRRRVIEPGDIGQQNQEIGARHRSDARRQPVIIAVANFARRHGVVFIDDRHGAQRAQARQRGAGVQIAPALFGVWQRQQHLPRHNARRAQRRRPSARQRDLADGGGRLAHFQFERAFRKAMRSPPQSNRARGDDQHIDALLMQRRKIDDQRIEPLLLDLAARAINQQGRADLDDDAAEFGEGGGEGH